MPQTRLIFSIVLLALIAVAIYIFLPHIKSLIVSEPDGQALLSDQLPADMPPVQQSALPTPADAPPPSAEPSAPPMGAINEALNTPTLTDVPASAMPSVEQTPLIGARWALIGIGGREVSENAPSLILEEGGRITGKAGCNKFSGNYVLEGDAITFPQGFVLTKMMCGEEAMMTETAFLGALVKIKQWNLTDGLLNFIDDQGAMLLNFRQTAAPEGTE